MITQVSHLLRQSSLRLGHRRLRSSFLPKTEEKMKDKVAIITAGTLGIGLASARRLGLQGAHVVVSSRNQDNVDEAVAQLEAEDISVLGVSSHAGNEEERQNLVAKTLEKFGGIDYFVYNAAVNPYRNDDILECSEDKWNHMFNVNLTSALMMTQLVVPHMKKRKAGAIVYVSSVVSFQTIKLIPAYSVSKTALLGLTKTVAREVGPDNIRVNCVAPGLIYTKFAETLTADAGLVSDIFPKMSLKRLGEAEDVAGPVAFLLSDDAAYITGETLVIAGGYPSRL